MRKTTFIAAALATVCNFGGIAAAQVYPSRPVTMIVSFAAGGAADTVARIVAEGMRPSLGQSIIIENVSGAGGSLGVGRAARSAPDGYTLAFGSWGTNVVNGALYPLQYDLLTDFEPVALLTSQPMLIIAKKDMPGKDLKELIAWLKANPDKATVASAGINSASHIAGVFFQRETGTHMQHVPYRGGSVAMKDLVSGQIEMFVGPAAEFLPAVLEGTLKGYAVTAKTRMAAAPDIPTVDEAGLPGLHVDLWNGVWVPANTPKSVIDKLNAAVVNALADPTVRSRLATLGQDIPLREQQTPAALGALQRAEIAKWWPILREMNVQAK